MTFWTFWAALRTWVMAPVKVRVGKASTVKVVCWPTWTRPTSASSTLVSTCILLRSCAMTKSTGAWRLAATVWPTSTLRATTTPSTGAFDDGVPEVEPGLGKIGLVLVDLGLEILEQRVGDLDLS